MTNSNTRKHQDDNIENFVRQNTRMIAQHNDEKPSSGSRNQRLYKCKDCNKEYDSFQALGGHRASHRTPKPADSGDQSQPNNQKLHECKVCKKGFEIGQSLGGHMRKHWKKELKGDTDTDTDNNVAAHEDSCSSCSSTNAEVVFKYDLNLTPGENECANGVGLDHDSSLDS